MGGKTGVIFERQESCKNKRVNFNQRPLIKMIL